MISKGDINLEAVEPLPRIESGEYQAICCKAEYGLSFGGIRKLFLSFRIYDGPNDGQVLFMACNRPSGGLTRNYKLYKQWCLAINRLPHKGERFCRDVFKGKMYRVYVRDTQRRHAHGQLLPDFLQYSIVDTILEVLTGVPNHD